MMGLAWQMAELYLAYELAVRQSLNKDFGIPAYLTRKYIEKFELKRKFYDDISRFEFTEPSKIARIMVKGEVKYE